MKLIRIFAAIVLLVSIAGCGDPVVDINSVKYEPKISVEGYLFCGEAVKDIRIRRNFKIGTRVDSGYLCLTPNENKVTATINGARLNFDPVKKTYYNNQLSIENGKTYQIEIRAEIDGNQLYTSSKTTTPQKGFSVINRDLGTVKYRQSPLEVEFTTSPGTDLYIFSIIPDSAGVKNFIYDNPYLPELDSSDVSDDFNNYRFQANTVADINSYNDNIYCFKVKGYDTWFYSPYTMTVYAGDKNFRYYLFTAQDVKEFDGNFHEPIQIFEGDGIGVFASAIKETVHFRITR
jgi:hypothetical protein